MSDADRLSDVAARVFGPDTNHCTCGSTDNLCRVTRCLISEPCCEGCVHAA